MAIDGPNEQLCFAYRQLLQDKIGTQAMRIDSTITMCDKCRGDFERRIRSLEEQSAIEHGMSESQAKIWGVGIALATSILTLIAERLLINGGIL